MTKIRETATKIILSGPWSELRHVYNATSFKNPNAYFSPKYQAYVASDGKMGWDGMHRPFSRVTARDGSVQLVADRGWVWDALRIFREAKISVDRSKMLPRPFKGLTAEDVPPDILESEFDLDMNQRACVARLLRYGIGIADVTVGGGKTAIFAAITAMILRDYPDQRVLYITFSERLVNQAYEEMQKFLPDTHVTRYGGGRKGKANPGNEHDGQLVVATAAMISRNKSKLLGMTWFDEFVALLYDEAHHATSQSSRSILELMSAFWRVGASDTHRKKMDKVVDQCDLKGLLGPILQTVEAKGLIEKGRLAKPVIYSVDEPSWDGVHKNVPHRPDPGTTAWFLDGAEFVKGTYVGPAYERDKKGNIKMRKKQVLGEDDNGNKMLVDEDVPVVKKGYQVVDFGEGNEEVPSTWCILHRAVDRAVVSFKPRNTAIAEWAAWFSRQGMQTVVVATRTLHVYMLENLIADRIGEDMVRILYADDSSKMRDQAFQWIRDTPGAVLVTPLVKEGVSINEIRAVVIADHVADYELANQIVGRAIRPKENDNVGRVVLFQDRQNRRMSSNSAGVLDQLSRKGGYTVIDVPTIPDEQFSVNSEESDSNFPEAQAGPEDASAGHATPHPA